MLLRTGPLSELRTPPFSSELIVESYPRPARAKVNRASPRSKLSCAQGQYLLRMLAHL